LIWVESRSPRLDVQDVPLRAVPPGYVVSQFVQPIRVPAQGLQFLKHSLIVEPL